MFNFLNSLFTLIFYDINAMLGFLNLIGQASIFFFHSLDSIGCFGIFAPRNKDPPPYFTNRDKIFYKDGPSKDGFYGIWTWSAVPNENDPSKDYILSRYTAEIDAIEIVAITQATSLDGLINNQIVQDNLHHRSQRR